MQDLFLIFAVKLEYAVRRIPTFLSRRFKAVNSRVQKGASVNRTNMFFV